MNITELTLLFASQALPAEEAARARAESESMQARGQVVRFPSNEAFVETAVSEPEETLLLDRRARRYREQVSLSRVQRRLLLRGSDDLVVGAGLVDMAPEELSILALLQ